MTETKNMHTDYLFDLVEPCEDRIEELRRLFAAADRLVKTMVTKLLQEDQTRLVDVAFFDLLPNPGGQHGRSDSYLTGNMRDKYIGDLEKLPITTYHLHRLAIKWYVERGKE